MIVQKLIILFLVTLLSIQIFPFEWVGVLLDKKTSCKNIAKLISLSSTDEEDNTENLLSNEEVKYFNDSYYTDQLVPPLRTNQHFPIYLVSHIADFYRKILIPPPNYRA
jgi:hypothetical protein